MRSSRKNVDRLSNLPEELHSQILSLMPTKLAVQTCILSKRWRHTWTLIHNFDFDDNNVYRLSQLSKMVDQVFKLYKTSQVNKFRMHYLRCHVAGDIMSKWISKAVALNVCELDIRVLDTDLRSMYNCKTLTKLRVHFSCMDYAFKGSPTSVNLPCLKTLEIVVGYQGCGSLFEFISGCPILENLSLEIKYCPRKADYSLKLPTLKRLRLTTHAHISKNKVYINLPKLEYLRVTGFFVMEDLSSLVEATINHPPLKSQPLPKFSCLKRLELTDFDVLEWLPQFLESCSELAELSIEYRLGFTWNEPDSIPICMLMNLKTITYSTIWWYSLADAEFLKFMLGNSKVLKMLTVKQDNNLSLKEKERIIMLPRASRDCDIHFV